MLCLCWWEIHRGKTVTEDGWSSSALHLFFTEKGQRLDPYSNHTLWCRSVYKGACYTFIWDVSLIPSYLFCVINIAEHNLHMYNLSNNPSIDWLTTPALCSNGCPQTNCCFYTFFCLTLTVKKKKKIQTVLPSVLNVHSEGEWSYVMVCTTILNFRC